MSLLALFTTGIEVSGLPRFLLMLPLCLSVAVVYKATRLENLREVPLASLILWVTIVIGMCVVGGASWLLFLIMA